MACTPPAPTFDDPSTWSLTHDSGSCQNLAVIHVSAGCGSAGYTLNLVRTNPDLSTEVVYTVAIPSGPISGQEFSRQDTPACGRGSVSYVWNILCEGSTLSSSSSKATSQGGPHTITSTTLVCSEECEVTATVRITNTNCGECPGILTLFRKAGVVPTYDPSEQVFSTATPAGPYLNYDVEYSEFLGDGTYFYSWRLYRDTGALEATSVPASVNPECTPYVVTPVALPTGEFEKQVVLVAVTGSPAGGWVYTDKKILNSNEQRLEWWYHKNGGCGAFRLLTHEFLDDYFDDALAQSWEVHVRLKLGGETAYTTWYRGVIRGIRQQEQGAEEYTEIDGYGYVEMLNKIQVQRVYPAGWQVKDVVDHIIANYVRPYTRILRPSDVDPTNGDGGVDASPYVLQSDVHFECSALKAIKFLAELQGTREFGVDADREFYFRTSVETVRKAFFIGHDLIDRVAGGKTFGAENQIKVAGKSFGSRDFLKVRADVTDVTSNGMYEVPHEVPWVTGDADASRWADSIIAKHKTTQDWSIFQWQNINLRVDATHPIGKIRVYGSDVSNDAFSYDVAKIQYIEGGFQKPAEVKEMGVASQQSNMDQPPLRAMLFVGQYPRDLVEELEIMLREQVEALKGRHKQYRYPNDVTAKTLPGRIPGEIKHFSKDVTNHDITNNPAEIQDLTNPRGGLMVWLDGQWTKVSIRRTVHSLPSRGKFIGEIISLITDVTNQDFGELRWWDGNSWEQFGSGSGGGSGPSLATTNPTTIQPDDAASPGVGLTAARDDHRHAIVSGTPVDVTNTNAEGVSTGFARDDHRHRGIRTVKIKGQADIDGYVDVTTRGSLTLVQDGNTLVFEATGAAAPTTGVPVDVTNANAEGVSSDLARSDHRHRGIRTVKVKGQADIDGYVDITTQEGLAAAQSGQTISLRLTATPAAMGLGDFLLHAD